METAIENGSTSTPALVQNGAIHVHGAPVASKGLCAFSSLSVRAWGYNLFTNTWSEILQKDVSGTWSEGGGEFPTASCSYGVTVPLGGLTSQVRVAAQSKRLLLALPPQPSTQVATNASVSIEGFRTPPDPKKKISVATPTRAGNANAIAAVVSNAGPNGATGIEASMSGSYLYCTEAWCSSPSIAQCAGHFCPPDVLPSGASQWPLPSPKVCQISGVTPAAQAIAGGASKTYAFGGVTSSTPGCGPCTNGDGRCASLSVTVSTHAQGEPIWQTWDKDSATLHVSGLVEP
jgi:hypothetical protein